VAITDTDPRGGLPVIELGAPEVCKLLIVGAAPPAPTVIVYVTPTENVVELFNTPPAPPPPPI
jgi:hypothetical protein